MSIIAGKIVAKSTIPPLSYSMQIWHRIEGMIKETGPKQVICFAVPKNYKPSIYTSVWRRYCRKHGLVAKTKQQKQKDGSHLIWFPGGKRRNYFSRRPVMELILERAQAIAETVKGILQPWCDCIEVAGSIRRKRPIVHDIDIVLIPSNQGQLVYLLQSLGKMKVGGSKIIRIDPSKYGVPLDIYVATPDIWATLLLIRTGSKSHNIKLCARAKSIGMKLHADGSGLFRLALNQTEYENADDERVAGDSEESIFAALGLAYVPPEKRE
jgi:hypothetical protein